VETIDLGTGEGFKNTVLLPQGELGTLIGSAHVFLYIVRCNNCYVSLQDADSDRSVLSGIWFTTERENEDKVFIGVIWVRESGWEKSRFSPQRYQNLVM